ncbi:endolytic transglycosylase MltG [Aquibacillus koreensis]|uniref:Endolytic murein transglycosylase n=1 Tax=Aquibacillus koreensis TaxID=279446 RepID=A0A9X4AGI6_9BACI|nr:endolytic transglycosylase MltG [Aquibacillus koreensis]MCT2537646.1 endolytic transglycosylase MltG [Aquibacillus koreensis]MDC3419092.1 endolytic transglycosylase MltG [Aquibacillus koreensis]
MSTSDNEKNQQKEERRVENKQQKKKSPTLRDRRKQRGEDARIVRRIVSILLVVITIAIAVGGMSGYRYIKSGLQPLDPENETMKEIVIPMGSSSSQIATILEDNGIIKNSMMYRFYIKFNNAADFQAGEYTLSPSMTLSEITDSLQTGRVMREAVFTVTIPEGKTIEQIAEIYAEKASIDKDEFLDTVSDPEYIQVLMDAYPVLLSDKILAEGIRTPLEGYLFAATYDFYEENPSVDTIVHTMLKKTRDVVLPYIDQITAIEGWTVHEAITMASLVENEARTEEERKRIAGVFFNRLEADMMLQTDPTVLYALGEHKDRVLYDYLEIESPYNTYQIVGLPIGPISNFGENSLTSVLEPEETNYMYFLAANGQIYYAETHDEHVRLKNQYLNREE